MKKFLLSLSLFATVFMLGCQGPQGPEGIPGPQGPEGEPGVNILGTVFDITGVNFTADDDYRIYFEFPADKVEVFESDAVLVYRRWETVVDGNNTLDVWRLLPQTTFMPQGAMQYNFDHTFLDVSIFLDAQFNRATLGAEWTRNQIFRVVIVPADFAKSARLNKNIDFTNYEEVKDLLQLDNRKIEQYKAQ